MKHTITISDADSHDAIYNLLVRLEIIATFRIQRDAYGAFISSTWTFGDAQTATMCKLKFG